MPTGTHEKKEQAEPPRGEQGGARERVLVVDDDADSTELLRLGLERRGFVVTVASSCAEARAALVGDVIDLIVADIHLPDGSGYDVLEAARALRPLPAIALTGFGRPEDVKRSLEAGFVLHLTKPVRLSELVDAIERVAGHAAPSR